MAYAKKRTDTPTDPDHDDELAVAKAKDIAAADYTENMFKDGHVTPAKHSAKGYDEAAHRVDAESPADYTNTDKIETMLAAPGDSARSRDGTESAGEDDESGGALGGSEKELDDLEASGVPVDKSAHMKD